LGVVEQTGCAGFSLPGIAFKRWRGMDFPKNLWHWDWSLHYND
jgi:hypothetical protein